MYALPRLVRAPPFWPSSSLPHHLDPPLERVPSPARATDTAVAHRTTSLPHPQTVPTHTGGQPHGSGHHRSSSSVTSLAQFGIGVPPVPPGSGPSVTQGGAPGSTPGAAPLGGPSSGPNQTRILLLSNFSPSLKTKDLQDLVADWQDDHGGLKVKWRDDTSAWVVFADPTVGESHWLARRRLRAALCSRGAATSVRRCGQEADTVSLPAPQPSAPSSPSSPTPHPRSTPRQLTPTPPASRPTPGPTSRRSSRPCRTGPARGRSPGRARRAATGTGTGTRGGGAASGGVGEGRRLRRWGSGRGVRRDRDRASRSSSTRMSRPLPLLPGWATQEEEEEEEGTTAPRRGRASPSTAAPAKRASPPLPPRPHSTST